MGEIKLKHAGKLKDVRIFRGDDQLNYEIGVGEDGIEVLYLQAPKEVYLRFRKVSINFVESDDSHIPEFIQERGEVKEDEVAEDFGAA